MSESNKKRSISLKKYWKGKGVKGTLNKSGYRVFNVGSNHEREYEHRLVWKNHFGEIPKGFQIHHKDGNKLNNSIENLELVPFKEHQRIHALKQGLGKGRIGIEPTNKTQKQTREKIIELRKGGMLLEDIMQVVHLSYTTVQKYAKEA